MKYSKLSDVYQIHKGETIYLIGNGPALLEIPDSYKEKISNGISIGVNSSHLFSNTTYQMCSTWSCYLLNCHYGNVEECRFYHGQGIGTDSSWPFGGATTLSASFFADNNTLNIADEMKEPRSPDVLFSKPNGFFYGNDNMLFSATNLATIMGASVIVYLGFEQKTSGHYYDKPELMELYKNQTCEMKTVYKNDPHILKDLEDMEIKNINKNVTPEYLSIRKQEFKNKLTMLIDTMKKHDVTPVVHVKNSVVYEAGAIWKDYEDE